MVRWMTVYRNVGIEDFRLLGGEHCYVPGASFRTVEHATREAGAGVLAVESKSILVIPALAFPAGAKLSSTNDMNATASALLIRSPSSTWRSAD